jgi:hypothetical protein
VLLSHGPLKEFLVPDSCGVIERNGNSISSDVTDDTIENNSNDEDVMSNLYRGTSIDVFYQVSVHLAKQFHRRRFKII